MKIKKTVLSVFLGFLGACADSPGENGQNEQSVLSAGAASTAASVRNLDNLRALTGTSLPSSTNCNDSGSVDEACCILVLGEEDHADGGGGLYCYKLDVSVADNGDTIIKPDSVSGNGRWVRAHDTGVKYAQAFRDRYPSTGGIAGALLAFGSAPACGEIRLPKGTVDISQEIEINGRWGCRIVGHGKNESGSGAGTVLRWTGGSSGNVFNLIAIQNSVFTGFMIDGNYVSGTTPNGASVGIRYQASSTGLAAMSNHFSEIGITAIKQGDGIAIHVGRSDNTQVDGSTFEKLIITHSKVGVRQEGSQTVVNAYRDIRFQDMTEYAMDFQGGDAYVERCDFAPFENSGAIADIRVAPGDGWATFISNYHETRDGASYLFPQGTRNLPVNLVGNRVYWLQTDGQRVLDYQQTAPLNLHGNSFSSATAGTCTAGECEVYVNVPGGGNTVPVSSLGNSFQQGVALSLNGQSYLAGGNDSGSSTAVRGNGQFRLVNSTLALEGGAMLWRAANGDFGMRQYYDSGHQLWTRQFDCSYLPSPCNASSYNSVFAYLSMSALTLDDDRFIFSTGKLRGQVEVSAPLHKVGTAEVTSGAGAPTGSAPNGSLYLRTDGTGPNLYVRENGAWVAK